jgi:aspartyl-tRNA(Asn)/glutamyl-tRNA(Gln) amidotransferase subunit A
MNKKDLNNLTIKQARELLDKKEITSVELTEACLNRIKEINDKVKAFLTVCEKEAIEEAKEADRRIQNGEKGDLLGIPYAAKDNILTKGIRTTVASKILENYIAPFDATIIKKLKLAGAVLLGKTNLDEFAHGASTENSAFGTSHNPWDLERVPGGSSGGSAAAVASDMCIFALGTDTGGSIRCPASFCNIVGLKPTYGRSSRFGLIAMTSSTDVPGPMTKTIEDSAMVIQAMAGSDKNDSTTPNEKVPEYSQIIKEDIKGLKLGVPQEFLKGTGKKVSEQINVAIEKLKSLGAEIIPIELPHAKYGIPVYYIITPSEVSSNLARFDGIRYGLSATSPSSFAKATEDKQPSSLLGEGDFAINLSEVYTKSRGKGFGPEAKRRIMLGTYVLSAGYYDAYYLKAQKVRTKIKEELDQELAKLDAIITPTQPDTAFKIGERSDDPLKMYLEDLYVAPASLAGLPAVSIPCGFAEGLPVGLQIIGKRFDEAKILKIAYNFEQATDWHLKKTKV